MNKSFRIVLTLLGLTALVAMIAFAVTNQNQLARARAEHQALVQNQVESERLTAENAELDRLRATNEVVKKLRLENKDLPRLRNEVRRLRREAEEAGKLRADNARLVSVKNTAPALPADFLPRNSFADVGLSTPEATIQTFFYSIGHGDIHRGMQCVLLPEGLKVTPEAEAAEGEELQKEFAKFPGFRIAEKTVINTSEVRIGIQATPDGVIAPMILKFVNNEWKVSK